MHFEVLGPLQVKIDGDEAVAVGAPQQQKLLALLVASSNSPIAVDRLVDEMWGENPPDSAHHLVQVYVSRLRILLRDCGATVEILRDGPGYTMKVLTNQVDSLLLQELVDEAAAIVADDPARAERVLTAATALWRGRPFADFSYESPLLQAEAVRLEKLYLRAVASLMEIGLDLGEHEKLIGPLEQITERHPYNERLREFLMVALYRGGRQAEALRVYQSLRRSLADELGIDPSPTLQEIEERILLQDPTLLWEAPPPSSNVPARLTSFVGRSAEIAEIAKQLDTARLVTLTGPGGIGKTRLAIEAAERTLSRFSDGVWWIDLAPITDPELVVVALANTLGVADQGGRPLIEAITSSLSRRTALLVVDNCEHLVPAVADLVENLLRAADHLRVLATSRVPLHVAGEVLWPIPALALPLSDDLAVSDLPLADAIRLFMERAGAVDPSFRLDEGNAAPIVSICRRLDGLPLAIEMAATRVRILSPAGIEASLSDRFAVLAQPEHGADPRHSTLTAAIDWSFDLLDLQQQQTFERIAVLAGEFDLDAVAAVAAPDHDELQILDLVGALVEASMISTAGDHSGAVRFRLLETLREYGLRRLRAKAMLEEVREAHAGHFLGLAIQAGQVTGTPDFVPWAERLAASYDDVRAALGWSLSFEPRAQTLRAAPALFHYWFRTGDAPEALRWSQRMLADAELAPKGLQAAAHLCGGFGATILGDPELSAAASESAIDLYRSSGDHKGLVTALFGGAQASLQVGDTEAAAAKCDEALSICDDIGDVWGRAGPLATLSLITLFTAGSATEGRRLGVEALRLHRELGDVAGQVVLNGLSNFALKQSDLEAAERFAVEKAAAAEGTAWEATALVHLAEVLTAKGEVDASLAMLRKGLVRALDTGLENWFRIALRDLARLAAHRNEPELAARLLGASRRNMPQFGLDPAIYDSVESLCRGSLSAAGLVELEEDGFHMSHQELVQAAVG